METPTFWREVYFCRKIFLETREEKKSHRGLDKGNRVKVLEN